MNHNNIKLLRDHSLGESQYYHRPTQDEMLKDYLNVIDLLTISNENRLKKLVASEKNKGEIIDSLSKKVEKMENDFSKILRVIEIDKLIPKMKKSVPSSR